MNNSNKRIWANNFPKLILATTVVLFIISLLNLYYIFEVTSQSNDECLWLEKHTKSKTTVVIFDKVKLNGVTWNAGIRNGDILIAIDDINITNNVHASRLLDRLKSGDIAKYTYERNGKIYFADIQIKKLISFNGLAFALLSLIWLFVGFIVLMAKPEGRPQRQFYLIGMFLVLFSTFNLLFRGLAVDNPILKNIFVFNIVDTLWIIGGLFTSSSLVSFFFSFPVEFPIRKNKWFNVVAYSIPAFLLLVIISFRYYYIYDKGFYKFNNIVTNLVGLYLLVGLATSFVLLLMGYNKIIVPKDKKPIRIIIYSYVIALIAIIYFLILSSFKQFLIFNDPLLFTPIILITIIPIGFGYSIFRYSLMDISDIVKNTIVYGAATVTLATVYFVTLYLLGYFVSSVVATQYRAFLAGFIFITFAIIFQSTKDRFQEFLTAKFFPESFSFQKGLLRFSGDIAAVVGLENVLDATKDLFVNSLRIQNFGIMLKNNGGNYNIVRQHGNEHLSISFCDSQNEIEKYFATKKNFGQKLILEKVEFDRVLNLHFIMPPDIHSIIPLMIQQKCIGLLLFGLKQTGSQFATKDLELLNSAANQTAISIENARLYESEAEKKKLERDLENARRIQETLLPRTIPSFSKLQLTGKMIPAHHVGGDYFDMIPISDDELLVVVGDVSGKGLSASLYMSKLQTMIRLYAKQGISPKQILQLINTQLYMDLEKNYFITVSIALFNIKTETVKLCRAGHLPYLLIRDGIVEWIQPAGIGVGLDRGEVFNSSLQEFEMKIQKEDLFLIYSDGVTEAMTVDGEEFGEERLEMLVATNYSKPVEDIQSKIIDDVKIFCGAAPQHDDITLLFVKYTN